MQKVEVILNASLKMRTAEAKTALGTTLHIHRMTWHYDSPFAVGWEHDRKQEGRGGVCDCVFVSVCVCVKKTAPAKWRIKGQLDKFLVQPSLPWGRIPL